jgi:hypothetical protein
MGKIKKAFGLIFLLWGTIPMITYAQESINISEKKLLLELPFSNKKKDTLNNLKIVGSIEGPFGLTSIVKTSNDAIFFGNMLFSSKILSYEMEKLSISYLPSNDSVDLLVFTSNDEIYCLQLDSDWINPLYSLFIYKNNDWALVKNNISKTDLYGTDSQGIQYDSDGWLQDLKIITLTNGNICFQYDHMYRSIYIPETNTFDTFNTHDYGNSFFYIDKYGYQYVEKYVRDERKSYYSVVDLEGNFVADLILPEDGLYLYYELNGDSDSFIYCPQISDRVSESPIPESEMGYTSKFELGINFYKIKRSPNFWEIEFAGYSKLADAKSSGAAGLKVDWPLDHAFDYMGYQNKSWLDEEGNLYYYELSNATGENIMSIFKVAFDLDTKIIDWARDGITEKQVTTPPGEITRYLEQATASELRRFRNTFFALDGYQFKSDDLNDYFSRYSWYEPNPNVKPDINALSDSQKRLLDLIQEYEG